MNPPAKPPALEIFTDASVWRRAVADALAATLDRALAAGPATLAVPGGRTALAVLPELATRPLDWARLTVTLVDERWVDADHPDGNEALPRRLFAPLGAAILGLKTRHPRPKDGLAEIDRRLAAAPPLAAALVGMGEDGHVASVFPGTPATAERGRVVAVERPDHPRAGLTLEAIAGAGAVTLATCGSLKAAVLRRALDSAAGDAEPPAARLIALAGNRLTAMACPVDDETG